MSKKIMLSQSRRRRDSFYYFFCQAVPKTANASQAVCKHYLFLCLLTPFSQRQSLRQLCGFANLLFFLIDEMQNTFINLKQ
jgi:hypothetical protein